MGGEWKGEGGERSEVQCRGGQREGKRMEEKHGGGKAWLP